MNVTFNGDARKIIAQEAWARWRRENKGVIKDAIRTEAPIDTGQLRQSVRVYELAETTGPGLPVLRAEAATDHAIIIHRGRGEVRPVNAKVLRWFDKFSGRPVYAMKSRAVAPNKFIIRALTQLGLKTEEKK